MFRYANVFVDMEKITYIRIATREDTEKASTKANHKPKKRLSTKLTISIEEEKNSPRSKNNKVSSHLYVILGFFISITRCFLGLHCGKKLCCFVFAGMFCDCRLRYATLIEQDSITFC